MNAWKELQEETMKKLKEKYSGFPVAIYRKVLYFLESSVCSEGIPAGMQEVGREVCAELMKDLQTLPPEVREAVEADMLPWAAEQVGGPCRREFEEKEELVIGTST